MVRAVETSVQELLEGARQYQVPLYQRTYSWKEAHLERLWEDVVKLAEERSSGSPNATHFIGSLVLAPSPRNGPAGVQEYLVVDGQQRLTTLSLLLCAIRDHRAATEDPEHVERINQQYLTNRWKPATQRLKLVPTQTDRPAYLACVDATPQAGGGDPIGAAYRYFRSRLTAADDPDDPYDVEHIENAVISGLALVSVTAQPGDNAHRIFESLNNTGLRLTQGDLLRNYLFMRMPTRGDSVYQSLWLPLQKRLTSDDLELLFWLDLVHRDPRIKQTDTYAEQQKRLDRLQTEAEIEAEVERFARLGELFRVIRDPASEPDPAVRRALERLNAWGTTTVYPLLLHLLDRRSQGREASETIARAMGFVESYFVRRLIVGRATASINRVLLSIVTEMRTDVPVDEAVRAYLSAGRKYFATDAEIRQAASQNAFYWSGKPHQKALVLQWLEESYGSKEPVDFRTLTVEHVLPQTLNPRWRSALMQDVGDGEDVEEIHGSLVHTLGNLTLTGYNSPLGNKPFEVKREEFARSALRMNQEIARSPRWGRKEILARAADLAERATKIWPGPVEGVEAESSASWVLLKQALAELPAGSWTTYGDVARLIGSHPVPVGAYLAHHPAPNAHRVLQASGTVSPNFAWPDPGRNDDPVALLEDEGVEFDAAGRANPAQRVTAGELARLMGLAPDGLEALPDPQPGRNEKLRDRFVEQLSTMQPVAVVHGVLRLLDAWSSFGGTLSYGRGEETTCFLNQRGPEGSIWPLAIRPSGKVEVVFQYLSSRPPFDDLGMREELRQRLNAVRGIDLPASKIEMRPGFSAALLADDDRRAEVVAVLAWFTDEVRQARHAQEADSALMA